MKRLALALACICVFAPKASAANCGSGLFLEVGGRMRVIAGESAACGHALKTSAPVATVCGKCRVPINSLLALDALMQKNAVCFSADRDKKVLKNLSALRENLQFIKRGCGF